MKRNNAKTEGFTEQPFGTVASFEVSKVREVSKMGIMFTLELNGVSINNCRVVEGKNGDFISFPSYKGSNDKFYNYVYFKFTNDDLNAILSEVEKQLNA